MTFGQPWTRSWAFDRISPLSAATFRATGYVQFNDTGGARSSLERVFDDNNRLKKDTDIVTGRGTDYVYGLDGTLASTKTFGDATTQTSTYTYEWWDDAKRKSTTVDASNNQYVAWNPGFTKFWYDANGNVKGALDEVGGRSFEYMTTANGQVLQRYEMLGGTYDAALGRLRDSKQNRHHGFFHFDGKRIGNVGNDGIEREDYVQQMSRVRDAEVSPDAKYRQYTPVAGADFDENYLPINASLPQPSLSRESPIACGSCRST
jgi:hypothetical protein